MNIALSLKSGVRRRMRVGLVALGVSCLTAHLALAQAKAPPTSTEAEAVAEEHPADRTRPWLADTNKKPLATGESAPFPWKSAVLLVGIASLGALAWRRRNAGRSLAKADRSARLSVLDSVRVGPRAQLVLTRVGDRTLLLGVTEDSVRRIAWIDQPATGSVQAESTRSDGRPFLDMMRAESARAERAARASSRTAVAAPATAAPALPAAAPAAASGATSSPSEAAPPATTLPETTAPVAEVTPAAAPSPSFADAAVEIAKSSNDTVEWSRTAAAAPRTRRPRSASSAKAAKAVPLAEPAKSATTEEASKAAPIESPVGDFRGSEPAPLGPTTSTISESRALDPNKAASRSELPDDGMEGQAAGVVQRRGRRRV